MIRYRLIAEGDTATENNNNNAKAPNINKLVSEVKDLQSGKVGAEDQFKQTLQKEYKISDSKSCKSSLKSLVENGIVGVGMVGMVWGVWKLMHGVENFAYFVGGKWGQAALVGALLLWWLYTLYSKLFKKKNVSESYPLINSAQYERLLMRKCILESEIFFIKLNKVVGSKYFTEEDGQKAASGIMSRAFGVCSKLFNWVISGIQSGVEFVKKHPTLIAATLIVIGLVTAYFKYPGFKGSK